MSHVFLSYSRQDTAFMQRLRADLRAGGFRVWTDETGLEPGTPAWKSAIERAIEDATSLVVILSPEAKQSHWVGLELTYAGMAGLRIIPVLVRGDELRAVPIELSETQWIDARKERDYDLALDKLVNALRRQLDPEATLASAPSPRRRPRRDRRVWLLPGAILALVSIVGIALLANTIQSVVAGREITPTPPHSAGDRPTVAPTALITVEASPPPEEPPIPTLEPTPSVVPITVESAGQLGVTQALAGHLNAVERLDWSPDGRLLASASNVESSLIIWDAVDGEQVRPLDTGGARPYSIAWSPDGTRLASAVRTSGTNAVFLWDADTGLKTATFNFAAYDVAWSPEGDRLAMAVGNTVFLLDPASGESVRSSAIVVGARELAFSPTGESIAVTHGSTGLAVLSAGTLSLRLSLSSSPDYRGPVAWSPDGRLLAWAKDTASIVNAGSGATERVLGSGATSVDWSPDGTLLAIGMSDGSLAIWAADSGDLLSVIEAHAAPVGSVVWSPDGVRLASGSDDGTILIWEASG